jgi:hypothetical protein
MRQLRHQKLKVEDELGRNIATISEFACPLLRMWVASFIARLQIGIYPSDLLLSSILAHEWHVLTRNGLVCGFSQLFPGLGSIILWDIITDRAWGAVPLVMKRWIGGLQSYVLAGNLFKPATERRILTALPYAVMALPLMLIEIDREALPIMIYADAQRLHFASIDPPFWPSELVYLAVVQRHLWEPLKSIGRLSVLTSPAALMLFYRSCFKYVPVQDAEAQNAWSVSTQSRVFQLFTSYRSPSIDDGCEQIEGPKLVSDPFGWILHQNYRLRTSLLKRLGWAMTDCWKDYSEQDDSSLGRYESGRVVHDVSAQSGNLHYVEKYRSTSLAHLPAQFLATRIDYWVANILLLPLSSTISRGVAKFYMELPLPKTHEALEVAGRMFTPFGGGPLGQLITSRGSHSAWAVVCTYSGRLCFGATLYMAVDILAFGMLYGAVRTIGVRQYGWGSTPSEEEGPQDQTDADGPV